MHHTLVVLLIPLLLIDCAPLVPLISVANISMPSSLEANTTVASWRRPYLSEQEAAARIWLPEGHAHLSVLDLDPAHLAPATHRAQMAIFRHQFRSPAACSRAKYLQGGFSTSGLGSQLHIATFHLAYAMETGRIFLWDANAGADFATSSLCARQPTFLCFFTAPTNCTPGRASDVERLRRGMIHTARAARAQRRSKDLVPEAALSLLRAAAPRLAQTRAARVQWWRGQALAFLSRLNPTALTRIRAIRYRAAAAHVVPSTTRGVELLLRVPLPPGVVSVHVRHGDKALEMKLESWEAYLAKVSRAVAGLQEAADSEMSVEVPSPAVLLTTDDPKVVTAAASRARRPSAQCAALIYFDVPRLTKGTLHGRGKLVQKLGDEIVHQHLEQLMVALEADAWVGTRESNIDRMTDELRCIWVPKCGRGHRFYDLHPGAMQRAVVY